VTRPFVVVLGEEIRPVDVAFVKSAARQIGARVVQLSPMMARDSLGKWLRAALQEAEESRDQPRQALSG
jgi:hypothetical protein